MSKMMTVRVKLQGNGPIFTIKSMTRSDVGRYFCKVTNSQGDDQSFADIDIRSKYNWLIYYNTICEVLLSCVIIHRLSVFCRLILNSWR